MILYMIFYILILTPYIFFSLYNITFKEKLYEETFFYFLSSLVLIFILPIFFYKYNNYIISSLISLILLFFIAIISYRYYKDNKYSLIYLLSLNILNYYTFCYILATSLTH